MPHVASSVVDHEALALLREWIVSLREPDRVQARGAIHPRVVKEE